ncbi:MAG: hypothetical protein AAF799_19170 [Myxococcota bacterium]
MIPLALGLSACPDDPEPAAGGSSTGGAESTETGTPTIVDTPPPADSSTGEAAESSSSGAPETTGGTTDASTTGDASSSGEESSSSTGDGVVECETVTLTNTEMLGAIQKDQASYEVEVEAGSEFLPDLVLLIFTTDDTGSFMLGEGVNASAATCEQCVAVAVDIDPGFGPDRIYLADMGTLEVDPTTPPFTNETGLIASWSGVHLTEINPATFEPVPGGGCVELTDAAVTGITSIEGWNCPVDYYDAMDGCDCGCGIPDPDCPDALASSCDYCEEGCSTADCAQIVEDDNAVCIEEPPVPPMPR